MMTLNMKKPAKIFQMVNRWLLCTLILVIGLQQLSFGQCAQQLRTARTAYDEGQLQRIPALLESCLELKDGFTDEEKTEAYRLLILSHIFTDDPIKADEAMLALLRFNPQFRINEVSDPAELINLYGTFRTDPIFLYGAKLEVNYSLIDVLDFYGLHSITTTNASYEADVSIGGSLVLEKPLIGKFSGRSELAFATNRFTYNNTFLRDVDDQDITSLEAVETQNWIALRVLGEYEFYQTKNENLRLSVALGPSIQYLLLSDLAAEALITGGEPGQGPDLDLTSGDKDMREPLLLGVNVGIGLKRKLGKNFLIADLRYTYGLGNITKKNYDNELAWRYGMALNDVRLNTLTASVGLIFPKYSPKKLTK